MNHILYKYIIIHIKIHYYITITITIIYNNTYKDTLLYIFLYYTYLLQCISNGVTIINTNIS